MHELEKAVSEQQLQADFKLHQAEAEFARALKKAQVQRARLFRFV